MSAGVSGGVSGQQWFEAHRDRLERAVAVSRSREAWTPFEESPSRKLHPPGASEAGRAAFEARLGRAFELGLPGEVGALGAEISPYTNEPLGIVYPRVEPGLLLAGVLEAWPAWRVAPVAARVGVCLELLERWHQQVFENTHATMHTAGQGFMLAFAGSGASSLDRGLEALAAAWVAMDNMPAQASYERRFGPGAPVRLEKRYRLMPVGVAVVFSCGSYPAWNAYPAILANLATGNPVVVKPHPDTILPVAIAVETGRAVLAEAGFSPDLLTLACDTREDPIAGALLAHPAVAIVDFTGGQSFGARLEREHPRLQVYTETAGCNAVVLDGAVELDAALAAIALGLVLFSAQMCTAPQNIWVPRQGVRDGGRVVPVTEVAERLVAQIDALVADPERAAGLCGALHSEVTLAELQRVALAAAGRVLRASAPYPHPEYARARTATPLLVALEAEDRALAQQERFGPIAFLITADDRDAALAGATADARDFGAIACYAYSNDPDWIPVLEDAFALAGASVGINLLRHRPINYTAAFSDYHVTGLNPAGTACLTDPAFVSRRFRVVQCKLELPAEPV